MTVADGGDPGLGPPGLGRFQRDLPLLAALIGIVVFGSLAALCWVVGDQNEQRLLEQQTSQASAALSLSIIQVQAALAGAARAAAATDGDPDVFERVVTPLIGGTGTDRSVELYDLRDSRSIDRVEPPTRFAT